MNDKPVNQVNRQRVLEGKIRVYDNGVVLKNPEFFRVKGGNEEKVKEPNLIFPEKNEKADEILSEIINNHEKQNDILLKANHSSNQKQQFETQQLMKKIKKLTSAL
jgi:hypothetical protein